MQRALVNGPILTPAGIVEGQALLLEGGRILRLVPAREVPPGLPADDLGGHLLAPGFIDTQVNGGGGVLFNDEPSVETIRRIGAAHRKFGTTGFLPTLISDRLDVIRRGISAVDEAIEAGVPGVLGIHIEGPFLNVDRKGVHDAGRIRALDPEGIDVLTSLARGRTLVTLAPEKTTPHMIAQLVGAGVIVSAGHTNATYADVQAAIAEGMSGFTHLFNAMSPLTSRAPGTVGAALSDPSTWCGLIVDGQHVDPVTMRLALRCKTADKIMLVTDGMPSVGTTDPTFLLQGRLVRTVGDYCVDEEGTLAGSNLNMAQAVLNAVGMLGADRATAIQMASANPADFLRLDQVTGRIMPGLQADLVLLDDGGQVLRCWIAGSAG